jgi:hypothetical protein
MKRRVRECKNKATENKKVQAREMQKKWERRVRR